MNCLIIMTIASFMETASSKPGLQLVPTTQFDCTQLADGYYPHPTSCSEYYMCLKSEAFHDECSPGMLFHSVTLFCEASNTVTCSTAVPPTTTNAMTSITMTAQTTVPRSTAQTTVPISTAKTTVPTSTAKTTVPTSTAKTTMPISTEQTTLPTSTAQTTVPISTAQTTILTSTSQTTIPTSGTTQTTVPTSTEQTTMPTPSTARTSVPTSTSQTRVPISTPTTHRTPYCSHHHNGVTYTDHKDCTKYLECDNGKLHHFQCPPTLVFNVKIHTCDYRANVPGCH